MSFFSQLDRELFEHFDNRFNQLIRNWENSFGFPSTTFASLPAPPRAASSAFYPALDVAENDKEVIVHTDLPGMKKQDVKLEVHGQQLCISGESSVDKSQEDQNWTVRERSFGKFERRITLPKSVDLNKIQAKMDNGVLEVKVPKLPEQQHQKKAITIQ